MFLSHQNIAAFSQLRIIVYDRRWLVMSPLQDQVSFSLIRAHHKMPIENLFVELSTTKPALKSIVEFEIEYVAPRLFYL